MTDYLWLRPPALPSRRVGSLRWGLVGIALMAVAGLVLGLLTTGAAAPQILGDPGPAVRWGLPVTAALARLAAMLTVGTFALCAVVLAPGKAWRTVAYAGTAAAAGWSVLQGAELVLTHASVVGRFGGEAYLPRLAQFLALDLGRALTGSVLLVAATAVAALLVTTARGALAVCLLGVAALLPLAEIGHAGTDGHGAAASAMWLHLTAVTLWVGGLAALALTARHGELATAAPRYSRVAGWCFAVVAFSGAASAWLRTNAPQDLLATPWGRVLLAKAGLFAVLGWVGYLHRRRTLAVLTVAGGADGTARFAPFQRLAAGELGVMGAVVGLSVALGSSAPPAPESSLPAGDVVRELTGYAVPPPPSVLNYLTQWRIEPILVVLACSGLVVYLHWARRLSRRGDAWPVARTASWVLGLVLFLWVTNGGPAVYGQLQFSVHMAQHLALVTVLPIGYALAAPMTLALRALPPRRDGSRGPREWLLTVLHSRWARFFAHPVVAALHVVVSMGVLYLTPLFRLTLTNHWAHLAMVVHISLVGYLFVNVLVGTDPGPRRPPYPARLALLLPSMLFHTFFGLAVLSTTSLIAAPFYARLGLPWVTDPLLDQQVGGALTWAMGELPALALALLIAARWAAADQREQDRAGRARALAPDQSSGPGWPRLPPGPAPNGRRRP